MKIVFGGCEYKHVRVESLPLDQRLCYVVIMLSFELLLECMGEYVIGDIQ